jgi:hypothetical protein
MKIICRKCKNILEIKSNGDIVLVDGKKFCSHCKDILELLKPSKKTIFKRNKVAALKKRSYE